jgi:uncharacterized protein (UPF0548 family)/uncharacterized membrane protein
VAEWRFRRHWAEPELGARLERAQALVPNFAAGADMTSTRGWNVIHSRALIAREPGGPPVAGGAFERLWSALQRFHHSDPRIVLAHFRDDVPLVGRRVLLELSALGLRFLCPAAIGALRGETGRASTLRGFSLETLEGHIERGREWFLLEKDHATGHVRFRIEAAWRPGDFPTRWSRVGFHLVGRRYQRAWHRLAHLRLRRVAAGLDPGDTVGPDHLVHEGPPMPSEPVQFFAQPGLGRLGVDVEEEVEEMNTNTVWRAIGLGALSGVRSIGPAAVVVRQLEGRRRAFGRRKAGRALALLAAGEVLDKLPFTPPRTRAPSLLARMVSGAFVGSSAARRGSKLAPGLLGAAAAAAATFAAFHARRFATGRSRAFGYAFALAEDGLVFWGGSRLAASARA